MDGRALALKRAASSAYDEDRAPAPLHRGFSAYPDFDVFNRDLSLSLGVPPELETASPSPNLAYATLSGYIRRTGFGSAAPAIVGTAVAGPIGGAVGEVAGGLVGGLFHSSAAGPNAAAANQVAAEVARGNLAAVAAVITRSGIQTQSSAAPWKALLATIPQPLIDAANQRFPGNNWTTFGAIDPSAVINVVEQHATYYSALVGPGGGTPPVNTGGVAGSPNQPGVPQQAGVLGGFSLTPTTIALGLGLLVAAKVLGGGRRSYARNPYRRSVRRRRRR